ncbi:hypothetical protein AURDEDRAFT_62694 [Auricularia subglabra TFB-10046 SS5]|nr:hypothetical protein AURDEDRAFT_62694 [Auricularia subglabra TFB-10046 SS5]
MSNPRLTLIYAGLWLGNDAACLLPLILTLYQLLTIHEPYSCGPPPDETFPRRNDTHCAFLKVTDTNLAYALLGGFAVVFAAFSLLVREKLYLGEVVLGTGFGVLMGPYVANVFDPRGWVSNSNTVTLEVCRPSCSLPAGLFAIGVELPNAYLWEKRRSLLIMVVPTMAIGWVISAALMHALFPQLNYVSCLVISATLTPTDPILANAIINGRFAVKHVPTHLRRLLAAESAANDGLAYPFLSLSMYLTLEAHKGTAFAKWVLIGWLYEVAFGVLLGVIIGRFFSAIMRYSRERGYIDRESYVAQFIALALVTVGLANLLGSDDLLAAFAAGSAVSWDGDFKAQTEGVVFSSVIDLLLNIACFIYIGAWLPFSSFNTPALDLVPWRLVVFFVSLLVLRRIPALLMVFRWVPDVRNWREAIFCGHFGPMGVSAIFVTSLALSELPRPEDPPRKQTDALALCIQPIVAFVVLGSIVIHGLSIPFFTLGRRVHSYTYSYTSRTSGRDVEHGPEWLTMTRTIPAGPASDTSTVAERMPHLSNVEKPVKIQRPHVESIQVGRRCLERGQYD